MMVRAPLLAIVREHGCEAWAGFDVISATNGSVVELAHEFVTSLLGECCFERRSKEGRGSLIGRDARVAVTNATVTQA
jgi:hypothetical protein